MLENFRMLEIHTQKVVRKVYLFFFYLFTVEDSNSSRDVKWCGAVWFVRGRYKQRVPRIETEKENAIAQGKEKEKEKREGGEGT